MTEVLAVDADTEQSAGQLDLMVDKSNEFQPDNDAKLELLTTPTGVVLCIAGIFRGEHAVRIIDTPEILERVLADLASKGTDLVKSLDDGRKGIITAIGALLGRHPLTAPLALTGFLALAGCGDKEQYDHSPDSGMVMISSALTASEASSFSPPVEVSGTQDSDGAINVGILGSNYHRIIARGGDLFVETCPTSDALQCVDSTGSGLQAVSGLPSATYFTAGVFEDANGDSIMLIKISGDGHTYFSSVSYNGTTLVASGNVNQTHLLNSPMETTNSDVRVITIGSTPFAIWPTSSGLKLRNLHTGADTSFSGLDTSDIITSGAPVLLDDGTSVLTSFDDGGTMKLATAASIADIQSSSALTILADTNGDPIIGTHVTQFPGSGIATYRVPSTGRHEYTVSSTVSTGDDDDTGTTDDTDTDGDGVLDGDDNCPDDHNTDQADMDGDSEGDVCDDDRDGDDVDNDDDNCPDDANTNQADSDGDGVGDTCDSNNDLSPQEMLEQACAFAAEQVTIIEGSCEVVNDGCDEPFVKMEGSCTFEIDMGQDQPVTIEIDGTYEIDLLEGGGFWFDGYYKVITRGYKWDTHQDGMTTAPSGTTYTGGEMPKADSGDRIIHITCEEGQIRQQVTMPNGSTETMVVLDPGEFADFIVETGELLNTNGEIVQTSSDPIQGGNSGRTGCSTSANSSPADRTAFLALLVMMGILRSRRKA